MRSIMSILTFAAIISIAAEVKAGDPQAESFARIYTGICLQHITNLEGLRTKLREAPQLPTDKAALFLQGSPGNAYPVPDKNGTYVVALPSDKNMCALFVRRVNAAAVEDHFTSLAKNPPRPYSFRFVSDERSTSPTNGPIRTVQYEWFADGALRKIVFTLTTSTSEEAQLQGLASLVLTQ